MIDGVMSLALCPQVVSQAPQHIRSSETTPFVMVVSPSNLSARLLLLTPVYQGQYIHRRFRGRMSNTDILPIQVVTFFRNFIESVSRIA